MQMREATPSALVPGNRKGANTKAANTTSMITFSSKRPGGSSETSQPTHDLPCRLPSRSDVETPDAAPFVPSGMSRRPGAIAALSARPPGTIRAAARAE